MTDSTSAVLSTTTAAAATQQVNTGLAGLTSNFQSFLSLLTAQLQNQDPTSPVDPNQFTQQIVQMSGVQQQLLTNNLLTTLVGQGQGGLTGGVGYIGKEVMATSPNESISGGKATWTYQLGATAANATVQVTDNLGKTVFSGPAPSLTSGTNTFTWNGKTTAGVQLADGGPYTLSVTAVDGSNTAISSQVVVQGTATSVQMNNGQPYLTIGSTLVPLSAVIGVADST
jgi:flagellar basal-body rod modification protein FlgD